VCLASQSRSWTRSRWNSGELLSKQWITNLLITDELLIINAWDNEFRTDYTPVNYSLGTERKINERRYILWQLIGRESSQQIFTFVVQKSTSNRIFCVEHRALVLDYPQIYDNITHFFNEFIGSVYEGYYYEELLSLNQVTSEGVWFLWTGTTQLWHVRWHAKRSYNSSSKTATERRQQLLWPICQNISTTWPQVLPTTHWLHKLFLLNVFAALISFLYSTQVL
jgi:hypothetical protein